MAALYKTLDRSIRSIKREVNLTVFKLPEIEQKALDATCNEPWGPHGQLLAELARASYDPVQYALIMRVLWRRTLDTGKDWRHVYKALLVVEYMVAHGAGSVVRELGERVGRLKSLTEFQYVDPTTGRDEGHSVRVKAKALLRLLQDERHIEEVREHAAIAAKNIKGYSLRPVVQHVNLYGSRTRCSSSSTGSMRRKSLEDVRGSPDERNSVVGCMKENMDEDEEDEGEEEDETQGRRRLKVHEGKVAPPLLQPGQKSNGTKTTSKAEQGDRDDGVDKDCDGCGTDDINEDGDDNDDGDFSPRRAHVLIQASGISPHGGAGHSGRADAPVLFTRRDAHTAVSGEEEFNPRRAAALPQPSSVSHVRVSAVGAGGSSWGGGNGAAVSTDADDDFNPRAATVLQAGSTGMPLAATSPVAAPSRASAGPAELVWTAANSAVANRSSDDTADLCHALTPFTASVPTHTVLPSWQLGPASPSSVFSPPSSLASPSEATFATFSVHSASNTSHYTPGMPPSAANPNPIPFPSFPPQRHSEENHFSSHAHQSYTSQHPFPSFPPSLLAQHLSHNPAPPHHIYTSPLPFSSPSSSSHHSSISLSPPTPSTSMYHCSWSASPFPPTGLSPSTPQHPPPPSPLISPTPASYLPSPVSASASPAVHAQIPTHPPILPVMRSSSRPSSSTQSGAPISPATLSGTKGPGKDLRIFDEVLSSGLVDLHISLPSDTPLGKVGVLPKTKLKSIREQQQEAQSPTPAVKYGLPSRGSTSSAHSHARPQTLQQDMFVQGLS